MSISIYALFKSTDKRILQEVGLDVPLPVCVLKQKVPVVAIGDEEGVVLMGRFNYSGSLYSPLLQEGAYLSS